MTDECIPLAVTVLLQEACMEKRVANLTKRTIASLTPEPKPYRVWDQGGKDSVKGLFIRVQPTGAMNYYFYYRNNEGKSVNYRIGSGGNNGLSPAQARDAAILKSGSVALGSDVQADKKRLYKERENAKLKTLRGFIDNKYRDWCEAEYKTGKQTIQCIEKQFAHLLDKPLADITDWDIASWRSREKKRGRSDAGINRQLAALKGALSRAVQWQVIPSHGLTKKSKQVKVDNGRVRYLSTDEELALRNALDMREQRIRDERGSANEWRRSRGYTLMTDITATVFADHIKPMVVLSLNTGMRRGEVFSLTWKSVNLETATLTVTAKTSKTNRTRHIPLNDEALSTLRCWQEQTGCTAGLVFPNAGGKRFDNVNKAWANVLKAADISDFHWHDLRHCFASRLVMADVNLNTVRDLLGHADIKMTLRYAHLAPEHKAAAVAKLTAPESSQRVKARGTQGMIQRGHIEAFTNGETNMPTSLTQRKIVGEL